MTVPEATDRTGQADLIGWLRAQISADEVLARRASTVSPAPWRVDTSAGAVRDVHGAEVAGHWRALPALAGTVAPDHIVAWDPARVLADVEAKRRILAWAIRAAEVTEEDCYNLGCEDVIRLLAEPYADRPGYQERWRP